MQGDRKWINSSRDPFTMSLVETVSEAAGVTSFDILADVVSHDKGFMCELVVDPITIDARFARKWLAENLQSGIEEVHNKMIELGLQ